MQPQLHKRALLYVHFVRLEHDIVIPARAVLRVCKQKKPSVPEEFARENLPYGARLVFVKMLYVEVGYLVLVCRI